MIRTVAQFLQKIVEREAPALDQSEIVHGPTIGDMYEGLSRSVLERTIPASLNLRLVSGFISDSLGALSQQIDCMLVSGEGEEIPYTTDYIWHIRNVVAVIEVKKTLYSAEMRDAFVKLRAVKDLEHNYRISQRDSENSTDVRAARRTFAEITGREAPSAEDLHTYPLAQQHIWHVLVGELVGCVRIGLGYFGFKRESSFRNAMVTYFEENLNTQGFGPGSLPSLIISGKYSLIKANGRPYSTTRLDGANWPFYFSSSSNPFTLLLELLWTRLDYQFGIAGLGRYSDTELLGNQDDLVASQGNEACIDK